MAMPHHVYSTGVVTAKMYRRANVWHGEEFSLSAILTQTSIVCVLESGWTCLKTADVGRRFGHVIG
jgi:hypothetical protein